MSKIGGIYKHNKEYKLMRKEVLLLLFVFFIPLVYAEPSFIFQQNQDVDLKISCYDINSTLCNNATVCTLTINYPNAINLIKNETMTYNDNYYNYTLNYNQTNILGEYYVNVECYGSNNGFSTFTFKITPTGDTGISSYWWMLLVLAFGLVVFGIAKSDLIITMLGDFGLLFFGIYMMQYGIDIYKNWMTNTFAMITLGVGMYVLIRTGMEFTEGV